MFTSDQEERIHSAAKTALIGAVGFTEGDLSEDRAKALKYFKQEKMGTERPGRSQVVTSEVSDTVLAILPSLMRVFTSAGRFVRYEATKPEGEEDAALATSYMNEVVFARDNNMFKIAYNWFHDALLMKTGIVTWYLDESVKEVADAREGLTDEEFAAIVSNDNVDVTAHSEDIDEMTGMVTHDIEYLTTSEEHRVRVENVAPDEFLISPRARTIAEAPFVGWRSRQTVADLVAAGYDHETLMGLSSATLDVTFEDLERFRDQDNGVNGDVEDAGQREVWVTQCYMNLDVDEKGKSRLVKITLAGEDGSTLLEVEDAFEKPFAMICPIPIPHVFHGLSMADLTMPLQDISTAVFRGVLDSIYLANNPRTLALEGQVNLDDLLNPRAGGVVRAKRLDAVRELNTTFVGGQALPLFDLINDIKENRTGVSRRTNGLSAEALQNTTATAAAQMQQGAAQRIDMIARLFADGVREMCRGVLRLVIRHQGDARQVKLRGQWQDVDPSNWDDEMDVTVAVGLGFGNDEERVQALMFVLGLQKEGLASGSSLVTEAHLYNTLEDLVQVSRLSSVDTYFQNPAQAQPKQPQQDPQMMLIQAQMEVEKAKIEVDKQKAMMKSQQDQAELQARMVIEREKIAAQMEQTAAKIEVENQKVAADLSFKAAVEQSKADRAEMTEMRDHNTKRHEQVMGALTARAEADSAMHEQAEPQSYEGSEGMME